MSVVCEYKGGRGSTTFTQRERETYREVLGGKVILVNVTHDAKHVVHEGDFLEWHRWVTLVDALQNSVKRSLLPKQCVPQVPQCVSEYADARES